MLKDKILYIVYPGFWLGYPTALAYAFLGNKIALYIAIAFTIILISCIMYVIIGALNHPREFVEAFTGDDDESAVGAGF